MALKDRLASPEPREGFICSSYDALPGSRRCRHYLEGEACALPDELQCIEWLRVNGDPPMAVTEEPALPHDITHAPPPQPELDDGVQRDLFGNPVEAPSQPRANEPTLPAARSEPTQVLLEEVPLVRDLTADEVASFKALGVEVCLASESIGEVWIVPDYTDQDRRELSVEHAATLAAVCAAFPGARVVRFEPKKTGRERLERKK